VLARAATEFSLPPANWLTVQASYTFTDAQNADDGSRRRRTLPRSAPPLRRCPA